MEHRAKLAAGGLKKAVCFLGAGDGTRTRDVQLGKLAFYH